jgi:hypothetical protein
MPPAPAPVNALPAPAPPMGAVPPVGGSLPPARPLPAPVSEKTFHYSRDTSAAPAPQKFAPPAGPERTFYYSREDAQPTAFQPGGKGIPGGKGPLDRMRPPEELPEYTIRLDVPGLKRLTTLESEASLIQRMRQEARARGERLVFPEEAPLAKEPYPGRHWSPYTKQVEPDYVCYQRLLFQQKNFERYGWDLGPITPILSAGKFYWDVAWLPYHLATRPCEQYECSAGYCLPGDPVPLLLYPPEFSVTGWLAQLGVVGGLLAIFP